MDYYRKLNEASRRNLEQPASPTPAAASAHDIQEKESSPPAAASADESANSKQQLQKQYSTTISNSIEDERKNSLQQMDHPIIVGARPTTPISRERYYYNMETVGGPFYSKQLIPYIRVEYDDIIYLEAGLSY